MSDKCSKRALFNKVDILIKLREKRRNLLSCRFAGVVEGISLAGGESHGSAYDSKVYVSVGRSKEFELTGMASIDARRLGTDADTWLTQPRCAK